MLILSTLTVYSAANGMTTKLLFSASNIEGIDTRSTVQRRMKDFSLSYLVYSILNGNLNLLIEFEIVIAN